jgi:uncharacterized protein (UPF0210 family)
MIEISEAPNDSQQVSRTFDVDVAAAAIYLHTVRQRTTLSTQVNDLLAALGYKVVELQVRVTPVTGWSPRTYTSIVVPAGSLSEAPSALD